MSETTPTAEQYDEVVTALAKKCAAYEEVLRKIAPAHGHANPAKTCDEIGATYEQWARDVLDEMNGWRS